MSKEAECFRFFRQGMYGTWWWFKTMGTRLISFIAGWLLVGLASLWGGGLLAIHGAQTNENAAVVLFSSLFFFWSPGVDSYHIVPRACEAPDYFFR